jgi:hypothetical protein
MTPAPAAPVVAGVPAMPAAAPAEGQASSDAVFLTLLATLSPVPLPLRGAAPSPESEPASTSAPVGLGGTGASAVRPATGGRLGPDTGPDIEGGERATALAEDDDIRRDVAAPTAPAALPTPAVDCRIAMVVAASPAAGAAIDPHTAHDGSTAPGVPAREHGAAPRVDAPVGADRVAGDRAEEARGRGVAAGDRPEREPDVPLEIGHSDADGNRFASLARARVAGGTAPDERPATVVATLTRGASAEHADPTARLDRVDAGHRDLVAGHRDLVAPAGESWTPARTAFVDDATAEVSRPRADRADIEDPFVAAVRPARSRPTVGDEPPLPAAPAAFAASAPAEASPAATPDRPDVARRVAEARDVARQLATHVRAMTPDGDGHRVQLRLDPPELGTVRIEAVLDRDGLAVTIHAERDAARDLIAGGLPHLRDALAAEGLGGARVRVDIGAGGGWSAPDGSAPRAPWRSGDSGGRREATRGRAAAAVRLDVSRIDLLV